MYAEKDEERLPSSDRFLIERRLGAGGFGIVYRAFDRKHNIPVALKTLKWADPARLYQLKHEFRSLAEIVHPNLVALYELLAEEDQWFFTMELIEGIDFLRYVRGTAAQKLDTAVPTVSLARCAAAGRASAVVVSGPVPETGEMDFDRLRDGIAQLVRGLGALHDAGKLHCDIKPSNVLVERGGRVVLLDFGLVTELSDTGGPLAQWGGTPSYMAPEQVTGRPPLGSSDWYAVGVMLYQCLTGRLPFPPTPRNLSTPPLPPSVWNPQVPADLEKVCMDLLRYHPQERANRVELLRIFRPVFFPAADAPPPSPTVPFVGRSAELAQLEEALEATRRGSAVVVRIQGPSGIGKTALVRHFLQSLRSPFGIGRRVETNPFCQPFRMQEPKPAILTGRCFDRESVPYKALDGVVDSLSRFLQRLPPGEAEEFIPRDIGALARLFPVLRRVEAVAGAQRRTADPTDTQELRRRAFGALRELLARLAAVRPVLVFIDDLQWGDSDSLPLIEALLREPDSPAMLFVMAYRSEEINSNPVLQALAPVLGGVRDLRDIELRGLEPEEARQLAVMLFPGSEEAAEAVAQETHGHPFFIDALLRYRRPGARERHPVTLEEVVREQVGRLPLPARSLLEVLAVAGRPVSFRLACEMLDVAENPALPSLLCSECLARSRGSGGRQELETYHDRIRETVVADLPLEQLRAHHLRLARTYAAQLNADVETVAHHYYAGGDRESAAEYAERAAERAAEALAFDRAAHLYRLALGCHSSDPLKTRWLYTQQGEVLTNAGRGREAAEAYGRAAESAPPAEQANLLRLAAEQFLVSGHFEEGLETLRGVLRTVGLRLPRRAFPSVWSILWRRAFLRLRGLRFRERPASRISPETLARIDACASATLGLGVSDPVRALDFHARGLLLALRAGEPVRIARALAVDVGVLGAGGTQTWRRTNRVREMALWLAAHTGDAFAQYMATAQSGIARQFVGRWGEALEDCERAQSLQPAFRNRSGEDVYARLIATLYCWYYTGDMPRIAERLPELLQNVQAHGDLVSDTGLRARFLPVLLLAQDNPEQARQEVRDAISRWTNRPFYFQHYFSLVGESAIDLYVGAVQPAWERITGAWPDLTAAHIFLVQFLLLEALHMRARVALALATAGQNTRRRVRQALADARRMEREKAPWADALALLVRAGAAPLENDNAAAVGLLARAEAALEAAEMRLYLAAARRRRGELTGDAKLVEAADEFLSTHRVRNPARMVGLLAPGFRMGTP